MAYENSKEITYIVSKNKQTIIPADKALVFTMPRVPEGRVEIQHHDWSTDRYKWIEENFAKGKRFKDYLT